jgi:hypothetical protein
VCAVLSCSVDGLNVCMLLPSLLQVPVTASLLRSANSSCGYHRPALSSDHAAHARAQHAGFRRRLLPCSFDLHTTNNEQEERRGDQNSSDHACPQGRPLPAAVLCACARSSSARSPPASCAQSPDTACSFGWWLMAYCWLVASG